MSYDKKQRRLGQFNTIKFSSGKDYSMFNTINWGREGTPRSDWISGTFWLHMEAFPACPQEGNGLNKNSLIWKTENQKKEESH